MKRRSQLVMAVNSHARSTCDHVIENIAHVSPLFLIAGNLPCLRYDSTMLTPIGYTLSRWWKFFWVISVIPVAASWTACPAFGFVD